MKKKLSYIILILMLLLLNTRVNAAEHYYDLEAADEEADCLLEDNCVPYGSYIIGTYLFAPEEEGGSAVFDDSQVIAATATIIKDEYRDMFNKADYRSWFGAYGTSVHGAEEVEEPFGAGVTSVCITHINGEKIEGATCPTKTNANNTATFISVDDDLHEVTNLVYYKDNNTVVPSKASDRYGYKFVCWTLKDTNNVDDRDCYTFTGATPNNSVFEAKYEQIVYTVNYDLNGATGDPIRSSVCDIDLLAIGGEGNEPCKFKDLTVVRNGYDFVGWSLTEEDNGQYFAAGDDIISGLDENNNVTLYAVWKPASYNIQYTLNNGVASNVTTYTYSPNGVSIELNPPVKENYVFTGWTVSGNDYASVSGNTLTINGYGNVTLVASYRERTVRFVYNNETLATCSYIDNTCSIDPVDEPTEGYVFVGWKVAGTNIILPTTFSVRVFEQEEITLEKVEDPIEYAITYDLDGGIGGSYKTSYNVLDVTNQTDLGLASAPTKAGYTFDKWLLGGNEFSWDNVTTGDIEIVATYIANTIEVVYKNGASETSVNCTYGSDCIIEIDNPTLDNSEFAGWLYNGVLYAKNDNVKNVIGTSGRAVFTAQFTRSSDYAIHYDLDSEDAYISGNAVSQIAPAATGVSLTTPYRKGYNFAGWKILNTDLEYVDAPTTLAGSDAVTKEGEKAIFLKATWTPVVFTFEFNVTGSQVDPVNCTYGTTCTLGDHSDLSYVDNGQSYVLVGWATSDGSVSYVDDYDVTNMYDSATTVTLVPQFVLESHKINYYLNGGLVTGTLPQYFVTGDTVTLPEVVTKEGYTFLGWVGLDGNAITGEDISLLDHDVVVIAQFRLITGYDVTFVDGYSGAIIGAQVCNHYTDCVIQIPAQPTRENYRFLGWTNSTYNVTETLNIEDVNVRDVVFVANWTNEYDVKFMDGEDLIDTKQCEYGDTCDYSSVSVSKENAIFVEWHNDDYTVSAITTNDVTVTEIVFNAIWDTEYHVVFKDGETTVKEKDCSYGTACTDDYVLADTTTHHFVGWSNTDSLDYTNFTITDLSVSEVEFDAVWAEIINVEFRDEEDELIEEISCYSGIACDLSSMSSPTKENYRFLGWTPSTGAPQYASSITFEEGTTSPVTYTQGWTNEYTISFVSEYGTDPISEGSVTCTYSSEAGHCEDFSSYIPFREGYRFVGWLNGQTLVDLDTFALNDVTVSEVTLVSDWTEYYTVRFISSGIQIYDDVQCTYGLACDLSSYVPDEFGPNGDPFRGWNSIPTGITYADQFTYNDTTNGLIKFDAWYEIYYEWTLRVRGVDYAIIYGEPFKFEHDIENGDFECPDGGKCFLAGFNDTSEHNANHDPDIPFYHDFGQDIVSSANVSYYAVGYPYELYYFVDVITAVYDGEDDENPTIETIHKVYYRNSYILDDLDNTFTYYLDADYTNQYTRKQLRKNIHPTMVSVEDENYPQIDGRLTLYGKKVINSGSGE